MLSCGSEKNSWPERTKTNLENAVQLGILKFLAERINQILTADKAQYEPELCG